MRVVQRAAAAALLALAVCTAQADQTIKIGFIDPLSGPFANLGESELRHFQYAADLINARGIPGGYRLEIVPFDSKASAQESALALKQAIDQGIHYVAQGNGSNVAHALVDALEKHNRRNPERAVVYLNYAAVDPALTNEKCSFWHFRFDADADMKMSAITDVIAETKSVSRVYLLNQDYAFGQAVARAAKAMLAKKRPDIQIVGEDLHPLGKVKDFAPYIAKIRASGADAVVTGNWSTDLTLLVKAAKEAGLKVDFYTYYAGITGTPPAIGESGIGRVKIVSVWHNNMDSSAVAKWTLGYRQRFPGAKEDFWYGRIVTVLDMLAAAITKAGSAEPVAVARALEGAKFQADNGEITIRADNHQLIQPLYIATFGKVDGAGIKYDLDRTRFGFRTDRRIEGKDTQLPTTCKMERP